jgi:hypothetical protein
MAAAHARFLLLLTTFNSTTTKATTAREIRMIVMVDNPDGCWTVTVALTVSEV